jgi:hypothetical protein
MIDSHPGGESGVVRVGTSVLNGGPSDGALNLDIPLAGRWRYQEND